MLGALQMELEDIEAGLDKMSRASNSAVLDLIAPDIVGQLDRLLSRANFAAAAGEMVFATDQPRRGLLSKLTGGSSLESPHAAKTNDSPTSASKGGNETRASKGGNETALAARLQRAMEEVLLPLQPLCDSKVCGAPLN
jgi:hypothetical protein